MSAQKYSAAVSFAGNDDYNGCNATQEFEIKDNLANTSFSSNPSSQSSSSASSNQQSGKKNSDNKQENPQDSNDEVSSKEISSSNNNLVSVNSSLGANPMFA